MRFLVRVMIPTEAGNKSTRDPNFLKNIEGFIKDMRAEGADISWKWMSKNRLFVVEVPSVDMIVPLAEPFFQMGADVKCSVLS
jgi:hypothetical protein